MEYSNVLEYLYYLAFLLFQKIYFFIIGLPWLDIVFWARIIAVVLIILFAVGIIYNLIGVRRAKKKETEAL